MRNENDWMKKQQQQQQQPRSYITRRKTKKHYIVCTSQAGNEEIIRWKYYPMLSAFFFFAKPKSICIKLIFISGVIMNGKKKKPESTQHHPTSQTRMWNKLERNVRGCILSDGLTIQVVCIHHTSTIYSGWTLNGWRQMELLKCFSLQLKF